MRRRYELLGPASWQEVDSRFPDTRKWEGSDGELSVKLGTSLFDGGAVSICAPASQRFSLCTTQEFLYSIPFNPETDGVGPLVIDDFLTELCDETCVVGVTQSTLGGELAERSRTVAFGVQAISFSTFHNRRPVIVYWSEPVAVADDVRIEQMRSSFRFIHPEPAPEATPFVDPTELVPFVDLDAGYEILVPRFWGQGVYEVTPVFMNSERAAAPARGATRHSRSASAQSMEP